MNTFFRAILVACGTLFVALGFIGIFVPGLPTTPFLLLAAWCYARSSERFHRWLLSNRWFGEYIKNYQEGRGMRLRDKTLALLLMWTTMGWTILYIVPVWWGKLLLLAVALGVTIHLLRIRTLRPLTQDRDVAGGRFSKALDFDRE
ncbi:MAG: YbaN family protein [Gammaproteobacteria bacterium]|nr:YbaN family protein [Gammaproteobacteria bacterium]